MVTPSLALALLLPPPAQACSVYCGAYEAVVPVVGATGVPIDAVPTWISWGGRSGHEDISDAGLELQNAAGEAVAGQVEQVISGVWAFTPTEPLSPESSYSLVDASTEVVWTTFTTGADTDTDAPDAVAITETDAHTSRGWGSSCWTMGAISIQVEGPDDVAWWELEAADNPELVGSATYGMVDGSLGLDAGVCSHDVPELRYGERAHFRVRAHDLSGNVGAWVSADQRLPRCSAVGGATASLAGGVLLLAGLLRRRR